MRELVKQGLLTTIVPELIQSVLEIIQVKGNWAYELRFLDEAASRWTFEDGGD
ncbi:MAG: hypothetical protein J6M64_00555 [Oscillospiraceae bacterium]|nr:hypothetical protein [Oscillospiraceae bacterium]